MTLESFQVITTTDDTFKSRSSRDIRQMSEVNRQANSFYSERTEVRLMWLWRTEYLEFHHGVPAHLVSLGVGHRVRANQLGFVANAVSIKTWRCVTGCSGSSWETWREGIKSQAKSVWEHGNAVCMSVCIFVLLSFVLIVFACHNLIKVCVYLCF